MVSSASSRVLVTAGIDIPGKDHRGEFVARYERYMRRFERTVRAHWDGDMICWDTYPPNAPSHDEKTYAFKLYAMLDAVRRGYTTLLWSDACVVCTADPTPAFEAIERDGIILVNDGHRLREWASDAILEWAGIPDRDALGDTIIAAGGFVGIDLLHPLGRTLWAEWWDAYSRGFTQTYWREHQKPENSAKSVAMWAEHIHISDRPDVKGSLGEEAMWGALSVKYGIGRTGGLFCTQSADGIFRSTGYDNGTAGEL